jgi:hypothetical protein
MRNVIVTQPVSPVPNPLSEARILLTVKYTSAAATVIPYG